MLGVTKACTIEPNFLNQIELFVSNLNYLDMLNLLHDSCLKFFGRVLDLLFA